MFLNFGIVIDSGRRCEAKLSVVDHLGSRFRQAWVDWIVS